MTSADVLLPIAPLKPRPHPSLPPTRLLDLAPASRRGVRQIFHFNPFLVVRVASTCPLALSHRLTLLFPPLCSSFLSHFRSFISAPPLDLFSLPCLICHSATRPELSKPPSVSLSICHIYSPPSLYCSLRWIPPRLSNVKHVIAEH